jgi:gamma-glutamylcysteine synthetase
MIVWRADFVRCLNTDDESIIISEMKRREANIKPIIIIDTKTKKATVKEFDNNKLKISTNHKELVKKIENIADYMIIKQKIINSNKKQSEKLELISLNERKYYKKDKLTSEEDKKLKIFYKV